MATIGYTAISGMLKSNIFTKIDNYRGKRHVRAVAKSRPNHPLLRFAPLDFPADPRDQVGQVDHESQTEHATRREKTRQRSRLTFPAQPSHNPYPGIPQHVIDDLSVFGLTPPSSLDEVRAVRNTEINKYHSDRFVNDPDRFETSTEIMQIYNAAFDRLRAYYEKP